MPNEVITMYKDKSYTEALYPRTMAGAVAWDDAKTLPQYLNENIGLYGIDTSRIIASTPQLPYTATEDCWVCCGGRAYTSRGVLVTTYVNNQQVGLLRNSSSNYVDMSIPIPLKQGQTLVVRRGDTGTVSDGILTEGVIVIVYGIKGGNS